MHERNVVHTDICTRNILLRYNEAIGYTFCLADFGLARRDKAENLRISKQREDYVYMPKATELEGSMSSKFDMYSVGVLLLSVLAWVDDKTLHSHGVGWLRNFENCKYKESKELVALWKLGVSCLVTDPDDRPSAGQLLASMGWGF